MRRLLPGLLALVLAAGCRTGTLPDPNDPATVPDEEVAPLLRRTIGQAADALNDRVLRREISDRQRRELLSDEADQLLAGHDLKSVAPEDAWIYADLLITANRFEEAIPVLRKAIEYAKATRNDDRRVNDSLRLARCLAATGKVEEGLRTAQAVIDSHPADPGPVLPATLLEIEPVAEGKGHDVELAHLLEEAIRLHLTKRVDPNTEAGKAFLIARPYHVRHAWDTIIRLYQAAGRPDLATQAQRRGEETMARLAAV